MAHFRNHTQLREINPLFQETEDHHHVKTSFLFFRSPSRVHQRQPSERPPVPLSEEQESTDICQYHQLFNSLQMIEMSENISRIRMKKPLEIWAENRIRTTVALDITWIPSSASASEEPWSHEWKAQTHFSFQSKLSPPRTGTGHLRFSHQTQTETQASRPPTSSCASAHRSRQSPAAAHQLGSQRQTERRGRCQTLPDPRRDVLSVCRHRADLETVWRQIYTCSSSEILLDTWRSFCDITSRHRDTVDTEHHDVIGWGQSFTQLFYTVYRVDCTYMLLHKVNISFVSSTVCGEMFWVECKARERWMFVSPPRWADYSWYLWVSSRPYLTLNGPQAIFIFLFYF